MANGDLNWIANYIWGIADDVLRDLYVRGKYRDVILPMTVLRRLDSLLEPTKKAVLDTLRDLKARASQQQLKATSRSFCPTRLKFTFRPWMRDSTCC
jgi:type I restriction enzyme M protein